MMLFIVGSLIGSFMLCLTYEDTNLMRKSHCDCCQHELKVIDLIPIVSFLLLGGRCRYCSMPLSSKYFISEVSTGSALLLIHLNPVTDSTTLCAIAVILIPLAIYDTERLMIPNFMLVLLFIILMLTFFDDNTIFKIDLTTITHKLLIIILLHLFFFLTKSIGYGDIKLFTILLIFLPIPFFIALFFVTYLIGGIACIIFLSYKTSINRMPLVPFITAAYFVVLILYEEIKKLYFGGFI